VIAFAIRELQHNKQFFSALLDQIVRWCNAFLFWPGRDICCEMLNWCHLGYFLMSAGNVLLAVAKTSGDRLPPTHLIICRGCSWVTQRSQLIILLMYSWRAHQVMPTWGGRCPKETRNSSSLETHVCGFVEMVCADVLLPILDMTEVNVWLFSPCARMWAGAERYWTNKSLVETMEVNLI